MTEGTHLYELICAAGDLEGHARELTDYELKLLSNEARHLQKVSGGAGIPALVLGVCEIVAADRFFDNTKMEVSKNL